MFCIAQCQVIQSDKTPSIRDKQGQNHNPLTICWRYGSQLVDANVDCWGANSATAESLGILAMTDVSLFSKYKMLRTRSWYMGFIRNLMDHSNYHNPVCQSFLVVNSPGRCTSGFALVALLCAVVCAWQCLPSTGAITPTWSWGGTIWEVSIQNWSPKTEANIMWSWCPLSP